MIKVMVIKIISQYETLQEDYSREHRAYEIEFVVNTIFYYIQENFHNELFS